MTDGVPLAVWLATIGGFFTIVALDLLVVARKRGQVRPRSAIGWLAGYIMLACLFAFSAIGNAVGTRGRHFGWMVLGAVAAMAVAGY